jgi:hypothetical protein
LALLLGYDPKHLMDHDLVQLTSLIERGKTTAHHEEVTHELPIAEAELSQAAAADATHVAV